MSTNSTTSPIGFTVYCDESRHDGASQNSHMAIGGLWVPSEQKANMTRLLRERMAEAGIGGEVKWSKTSAKMLPAYRRLIDFFFEHDLHFRAIVVEQNGLNFEKFKDGDEELGFYTFYFEMLVKWMIEPVPYLLLLDFKKNKGADHYTVLRRCLEHKIPTGATLRGVHVIDSRDSPLAQLSDLLVGAVAASWCGIADQSPKAELAAYIAGKAGRSSLKVASASPGFAKFNIFKIWLQ
jgi:hypothetical protein